MQPFHRAKEQRTGFASAIANREDGIELLPLEFIDVF